MAQYPLGGTISIETDLIDGDSAGDHTVTGISTMSMLISVIEYVYTSTSAPSEVQAQPRAPATTTVSDVVNLTSEFRISADDTINNVGGTDTTGNKLLVTYFR